MFKKPLAPQSQSALTLDLAEKVSPVLTGLPKQTTVRELLDGKVEAWNAFLLTLIVGQEDALFVILTGIINGGIGFNEKLTVWDLSLVSFAHWCALGYPEHIAKFFDKAFRKART